MHWEGRAKLRTILYMAGYTSRHCNPFIRESTQSLRAAGKSFKVVMVAHMRKLLVILNAMLNTNTL